MANTNEGKNRFIAAGMFCYGPRDFSFDLRENEVKGVVFLVHGGMVYCDFFWEAEKPSAEVSDYIRSLRCEGFDAAVVWLPTMYEQELMVAHHAQINAALERIHQPVLSGAYLSSSYSFGGRRWIVSFPDGGRKSSEKRWAYKVRPVLRFAVPD